MELDILRAIDSIHNPVLDSIMVFITHLGDAGIFWIAISVVLLFFKKYRKIGVVSLGALILSVLFTNVIIKNLFDRVRPFMYDEAVRQRLLIAEPFDSSFPSGHSSASMAAAVSIFIYNKKIGIPALAAALLIAFSRLYLFVHFPTDVLTGLILGILYAVASAAVVKFLNEKYKFKWLQ
jgi:undecaprenyl-diphosphatase